MEAARIGGETNATGRAAPHPERTHSSWRDVPDRESQKGSERRREGPKEGLRSPGAQVNEAALLPPPHAPSALWVAVACPASRLPPVPKAFSQ